MKVRIKKLPQARTGYQVQGSLANDVPAMGGADYNTYTGKPKLQSSKYLTAVPRYKANLEAEGGETAYGDINGDGLAEHKIIKGPRHSNGGVPLYLPDDTFIYSDFRGMSINEPEFLQMFGKAGGSLKSKKKSYTPAELAKQYDIEKYRKILQDPDSDYIDKKTAELMIKNYQTKLGMLAIVQESKKGFPQGEAKAFQPAMAALGINTDSLTDPGITAFEKQIQSKIEALKQQQEEQQPDEQESSQEAGSEDGYAEAQELNQGQPVAQPGEMEQPMARYGLFKAKKGMAKEPCPPGMVYDPVYGCISVDEKDSKEYTPEQIKDYLDKINTSPRWFKDLQENLPTEMFQKPSNDYLRKLYKDNHIPYEEVAPGQYIVPQEQMNIHQKIQKNYTDEKFMNERFRMLDKMGIPPNKWIENLDKFDDQYDGSGIKKSNDSDYRRELEQQDIKYEKRMENCPCRKKQVDPVSQSVKEICVPCEQMAMAQYGMSMGGYDLPYGDDVPEAEYGMAMGANPRNYMGRPKSPMYARGGALRAYQEAGATGTDKGAAATDLDVTGKSDAEIRRMEWDAKDKDPNANIRLVRKNAKGKVVPLKRVEGNDNYQERGKKYGEADFKDKKYKDTPANRIALAQIEMFEQQLNDPKFGAEYVKETQEALKDARVFKTKNGVQGKIYKDAYGKEPTPEEIKASALNMFKRNTLMQAQGFNARLLKDNGAGLDKPENIVRDGVINPTTGKAYTLDEAKATIADYKAKNWTSVANVVNEFGLPPIGAKADIALEQTTTHGYARLNDKLNSGEYNGNPDLKYTMMINLGENRKGELNSGRADEKSMQNLYKNSSVQISPSDGYYGNTSAEQKNAADPGSVSYSEEEEPETENKTTDVKTDTDPECECETADGGKINPGKDANGQCLPCPEEEVLQDVPKEPAKFWTQDNIKTAGAVTDLMSINKYPPLSTTAMFDKNEFEYVDPTRALSANAEQAKIASDALSQIGAPQAAAANILGAQGKSAANAANIISEYDIKNQAYGSQYAANYANIENQERSYNLGARQKMYDSTVMANQAYDNAKRAARNNVMNAYTNALTNRSKTDALNQIYSDYQIHPDKAGEMTYKGAGRELSTGKTSDPYFEARKKCVDAGAANPDECAKNSMGGAPANNNKGAIVDQLYGKEGGYVYSDIVYPFVL